MVAKKRRTVRLVTLPEDGRRHAVGLLRRAIGRLESGESRGVVILESIPGDAHNYRLGWSSIPNRFELVGLLEEMKHQLLASQGDVE